MTEAAGLEPSAIIVSQPFLNRETLLSVKRPTYITIRKCDEHLWGACERLQLPVTVYSISMMYLQRFIISNPSVWEKVEQDDEYLKTVCCACLSVGLLNTEHMKKLSDVVHAVFYRNEPTTPSTIECATLQRDILETLCFDLRHVSPHVDVINLGKQRSLNKEVVWQAWNLTTDAVCTSAMVRFKPKSIAAACLEIAYRFQNPTKMLWDKNTDKFVVWPELRTSSRLILEYINYCIKSNTKKHSSITMNSDLRGWMQSLQDSNRPYPCPVLKITRDPSVPQNGTARYRI